MATKKDDLFIMAMGYNKVKRHRRERMSLGKAIERLRLDRGLTQNQLARELGRDPSYLSRLEADRVPNVRAVTIAAMVQALGTSADHLFIQAGWLPNEYDPGELNLSERRLIKALRHIASLDKRLRATELFTWVAEAGAAADVMDQQKLRLVAEAPAEYDSEADPDADGCGSPPP